MQCLSFSATKTAGYFIFFFVFICLALLIIDIVDKTDITILDNFIL